MTRMDLDDTSRAEYLFSAAPTTTRQTTDCAPNGGYGRCLPPAGWGHWVIGPADAGWGAGAYGETVFTHATNVSE